MCRNIHTLFNFEPPATDGEGERDGPAQRPDPASAFEVVAEGVHGHDGERRDRGDERVERDAVIAGRVGESDTEDDEGGEHATSHPAATFAASSDVPAGM